MAGKCILCGGKLRNGICTECGMDNNKTDAAYRAQLNSSQCEGAPLTHVHGENNTEPYNRPVLNRSRQQGSSSSAQSGNTAKKEQGANTSPRKYTPDNKNTRNAGNFNSYREMSKGPGSLGGSSFTRKQGGNKAGLTVVAVAVIAGIILVSIGYANKTEVSSITAEKIFNDPDYQEPLTISSPMIISSLMSIRNTPLTHTSTPQKSWLLRARAGRWI